MSRVRVVTLAVVAAIALTVWLLVVPEDRDIGIVAPDERVLPSSPSRLRSQGADSVPSTPPLLATAEGPKDQPTNPRAPSEVRPRERDALRIHTSGGDLQIRVVSDANRPVAGAWVRFGGLALGRTDERGTALLERVRLAPGRLTVRAEGFGPVERRLVAPAAGMRREEIVVLARGLEVTGRVTEEGTDRPLAGVTVRAESAALRSQFIDEAVSAEDGAFQVRIDAGDARVTRVVLAHAGYVSEQRLVVPGSDLPASLVVRLTKGIDLEGLVVDPRGIGVSGVRIQVAQRPEWTSVSGAQGRFRLRIARWPPSAGSLTALGYSAMYGCGIGVLEGPAEHAPVVRLRLEGTGSLTGTLRDGGGKAVTDARVRVRPRAGSTPGQAAGVTMQVVLPRFQPHGLSQRTDGDGRFAFPALPVGTYDLEVVRAPALRPRATSVVVSRGTSTSLDLVLAPEESGVTGEIVDADGRPIGGALVRAWPAVDKPSGISVSTVTGMDGRFHLQPWLDDVAVDLLVTAEGHATARVDDVQPGESVGRLVLRRLASVEGRVLSGEEPVTGVVMVELRPAVPTRGAGSRPSRQWTRFLRDGSFRLDGLPDGRHQLIARTPDGSRVSAPVEFLAGSARVSDPVELRLPP